MALLDRVNERRREAQRAADPITLEEFGALLGRSRGHFETRSGIVVTDNRALGITAWYSGVRYLAESVAFLPVHTYRDTGTLSDPTRSRRASPLWLQRPDRELPREGLLEFAMYSMIHRGNAMSLKLRDDVGRVFGLRPIHPDRVRFGLASEGSKVFAVRADDGGEIPLTTREIFHIPAFSTDGVWGLSALRAHAESLGIVAATDEARARHYANASHPGGVLSVPQDLTPTEADGLKEEWERFHRGLKNRERIGVLSKGAKYETISMSAADAQLLQASQYGVTEVSRILRIPPHKLYELTRATFSNIEHQSIESVMDGIRPWVERIETWTNFDRDLMPSPRDFIEMQIEGMLRGDTLTRYRSYQIALGGHPFMAPAEPRKLENLPPKEGLDEVPQPLNMGRGGSAPGSSEENEDRMDDISGRLERLEQAVATTGSDG